MCSRFKKPGLKALKCVMKDFYMDCSVLLTNQTITHAKRSSLAPAEALELPLAACAHWKERKSCLGCGTGATIFGGSVSIKARECGGFPAERICWQRPCPFVAPQTAPAPRFGSNTPPCSPAPQKSLAPKTKRLIMEIMQIRRELQITSSSPASLSTARAASSRGTPRVGNVWEQAGSCQSSARLREAEEP